MIVMEYIEGGNLAEAIVGESLKSWEVKTQIAKDISLGLAYLHSRGIIHCDIKSSNILLTEHKEARICDFGLAIRAGESGGGGTLQLMAPELLLDPPQYTCKSDMYALGMVMWEMASERSQPYRGHTPDGIMYSIMNGVLEEIPDNTPDVYAACIRMCWAMDLDKRPAAADVLPGVQQSSRVENAPEQQPRNKSNNTKMEHYLKALEKAFKTIEFADSVDIFNMDSMDDDVSIMDWFESSTGGSGSAKAMFKMGTMYYNGRGGMQSDYGEALAWYLAASETGVAVAMLKISQMYQYGRGVEQSDEEAESWYCKGQEAVKEQGRFNNRIVHHEGGVSEHHTKTMEWFSNDRDGEAARIRYQIGRMYSLGNDLEQDHSKAREWYLKASASGNAAAMRNLGIMHHRGEGVEQDYGKAMEWLLRASEAGNTTAMSNVGTAYRHGYGVEKDYGKAMEWFLKASDAGNALAMNKIGAMCGHGRGVEKKDEGKAMEWFQKAGDAGNVTAMNNMGLLHRTGRGVEQDYAMAMEWYLKASDAGNADAMLHIGDLYRDGQGVLRDCDRALEWFTKARDAGHSSASARIEDM